MYTLNDYESTEAKEFHPFENPPSGGYVFEVVSVNDKAANSGAPMTTLGLDIAEGPHKGAFAKFPKPYRQLLLNEDGKTSPYFKAMMQAFGKSNPAPKMAEVIFKQRDGSVGYNPQKLMGLRVGGNLREAEYFKQGTRETKVGLEVSFLGPIEDVPKMRALPLKKLQGQAKPATKPASSASAPVADDSDLPF
jgi:Protein of unknown function (DUF669)